MSAILSRARIDASIAVKLLNEGGEWLAKAPWLDFTASGFKSWELAYDYAMGQWARLTKETYG